MREVARELMLAVVSVVPVMLMGRWIEHVSLGGFGPFEGLELYNSAL